jgi:hypothetical protein
LGDPYEFKIVDVRPGSVDLLISPTVSYKSSDERSMVGSLTMDVGETIKLQTMSFDSWVRWDMTLEGIA